MENQFEIVRNFVDDYPIMIEWVQAKQFADLPNERPYIILGVFLGIVAL